MGQENYYSAPQMDRAFAHAQRQQCVVAALYTSQHCPFCIALKREQLTPRMRSDAKPCLIVIEIDPEREKILRFPQSEPKTTVAWARQHNLALFPTLVMISASGSALTAPLIGYSSKDFYSSYLDDQIRAAQAYTLRPPAQRRPQNTP